MSGVRIGLFALVLASLITLFIDITTKELHATSVFYAALARELVVSNDPLFIFKGPEAYLLKPPLAIWMSALAMKWLGYTHAAATLAPRLAGLAVVALTYVLVKRTFDARVGVLAAFVLVTNSTFIQFSTTLRMESLVLGGILLALLGWLRRDTGLGSASIFGGIAIAVLAKGPVGLLALPLMAVHWALLPATRRIPINWFWAPLLVLPVTWYGYLWLQHGATAAFSLTSDFMRATANPELSFGQSVWLEYANKPFRRYWPWLPFMLAGLLLPVWRTHLGKVGSTQSRLELWFVIWFVLVIIVSALKPDHDIRYLYPAVPALAALAGVVLSAVLDVIKGWMLAIMVACLLSGTVWLIKVHDYQDWRGDLHAMQSHAESYRDSYVNPVVIAGYPITPGSPRRQNTHRDWVYYYLGLEPRIISHWANYEGVSSDLPYVLTTRSKGYETRLQKLGFRSLFVTKEMVLAVPRG